MNRRLFIILFAVASIIGVSIIVWYFFFKTNTGSLLFGTPTNPFGKTPPSLRGSEFVNGNNGYGTSSQTERTLGADRTLVKVWDRPTAGFSFIEKEFITTSTTTDKQGKVITVQKKATSTEMLFADRTTGYIYDYDIKNQNIYQITNTLTAGIYDIYFFNNGKSAIIRYLSDDKKTIISNLVQIPTVSASSSPQEIKTNVYLPNNIISITPNYNSTELSYLVKTSSGSNLYTLTTKGSKLIKSFQLSELNVLYDKNNLYVYNKPSIYALGFLYDVKNNENILSKTVALSPLVSHNGQNVMGSFWSESSSNNFMFNKSTASMRSLSIYTPEEKCVWNNKDTFVLCGVTPVIFNKKEGLPDDWYKGRVSFDDSIYMIDNVGKREYDFFDFTAETSDKIDLTKPKISNNDELLGFINKKDGSFWMFKVKKTLDNVYD